LEYLAAERKIILKWALENSWFKVYWRAFLINVVNLRVQQEAETSSTPPERLRRNLTSLRVDWVALRCERRVTAAPWRFVFCFQRSPPFPLRYICVLGIVSSVANVVIFSLKVKDETTNLPDAKIRAGAHQ
jgi:hypothetical protein